MPEIKTGANLPKVQPEWCHTVINALEVAKDRLMKRRCCKEWCDCPCCHALENVNYALINARRITD